MSLETEIASLTLAVQALTKALASQPASIPPTYVEADLGQAQPEPVKAKPVKAKPVKVEAPTPEPEPEPAPAIKYTVQDIRSLAQAALDDGKLAGVVAINKEFGLKKISEATEDKFAEIIARLTTLVHG